MIKDIFKNISKDKKQSNKPTIDKLANSILDGYVDIKAYRKDADGNRKLVYHDTGDNVVTNWMRQAIITLLTGSTHSENGNQTITPVDSSGALASSCAFSKPNDSDSYHHSSSGTDVDGINLDGYVLNGSDYFWQGTDGSTEGDLKKHYSCSRFSNNVYAYFPTKVLFGTGVEYNSWSTLKVANSTNTTYIESLETLFGSEALAQEAFTLQQTSCTPCNTFSGTVSDNTMSGDGNVVSGMRTLNPPSSSTDSTTLTNSELVNAYNVKGAVKTVYFSEEDQASTYLQSTNSDSGRLLKPKYRGIGRPCFIYFNTTNSDGDDADEELWDNTSATNVHVTLSKDSSSDYLSRITFKISMPSQSTGVYYPYNGYTLNQIGLYNDTYLTDGVEQSDSSAYPYTNSKWGTLLAIKHISSFTKTSADDIELTWVLSI